jgi:hypothetical protein
LSDVARRRSGIRVEESGLQRRGTESSEMADRPILDDEFVERKREREEGG